MSEANLLKNLNPEQQQAVAYGEGPVLIVAGAGTGKTTVITHRIAYLIEKGLARPEEIVALAFTEKSAGEMEERIDRLLPYGYTNLWVSTFHSFCQKLLEDYGIEIGLPEFKILDDTQRWLFFRKNFNRFDLDYYRPRGNPNKFIRGLLDHFSRLKDECVSPQEYLKYVESVRLNQDSAESIGSSNFQFPISNFQLNPKSKIQNSDPTGHHPKGDKTPPPPTSPSRGEGEARWGRESEVIDVTRLEEVADAYHIYQNLLLENGYLDFGDLINYTIELFKTRSNILEEYRNKFKYILIDEFQDTNWAQYELIKLLAMPRNNLTVVGDDEQSIYKFRGASLSNILQFKNDFPNAKEVVLVKNYRTTQDILDLSYKFIQQNQNRLETRLGLNKKLISQNGKTGEISHLHFNSLDDEVEGVTEKILGLKEKDEEVARLRPSDFGVATSWDDFAILVRANDHATPFCQALARRGVPFQFMSLKGLYTKTPILDVLSYLKLLDNYHESPAFYRVLSWPFWKIKLDDLVELSYRAKEKAESLYEVAEKAMFLKKISDEGRGELAKIIALISRHAVLAREKTPTELAISIIKDTGYLDFLNTLSDQEKKDAFDYLNQFLSRAKKFEETNPNSRVRDFLEELNLEIESGEEGPLKFDPDIGPEMVRVMTVHSAKGLEFKYIFLVNLVDRRFPTTERREQIEVPKELIKEILPEGDVHLEEERRLFYVGMTRAKQGLYLTSAEDYGGVRKKKLSRFLIELGYKPPHSPPIPRRVGEQGEFPPEADPPWAEEGVSQRISYAEKNGRVIYVPTKFSFTQYIAYKTCPLQYKFRHIIKIPTVGSYVRSFGVSIHNTLREFVQEYSQRKNREQKDIFGPPPTPPIPNKSGTGGGMVGVDELLKIYKKRWIDEWYPDKKTKEEYFNKGKDLLKLFYDDFVKVKPVVKFLEQDFTLKIGGLPFKGKIDRVDEEGDGAAIIDYKTGRGKSEDELKSDDKTQLLIYQIALEESMRLKPKKLVYYYLEDGSKVEFLGGDEDKRKAREDVEKQILGIRSGNFEPNPGEHHCRYCDFKDICEYREL